MILGAKQFSKLKLLVTVTDYSQFDNPFLFQAVNTKRYETSVGLYRTRIYLYFFFESRVVYEVR